MYYTEGLPARGWSHSEVRRITVRHKRSISYSTFTLHAPFWLDLVSIFFLTRAFIYRKCTFTPHQAYFLVRPVVGARSVINRLREANACIRPPSQCIVYVVSRNITSGTVTFGLGTRYCCMKGKIAKNTRKISSLKNHRTQRRDEKRKICYTCASSRCPPLHLV